MNRTRASWATGAILGIAALAFSVGAQQAERGQPGGGAGGKGPTPNYYGVAACKDCHNRSDRNPNAVLCRCDEISTWERLDKHKIAYDMLESPRAKDMGRLLKLKEPVSESKSCLTCHGTYVPDENLKDKKTFDKRDGVSCVACHGAFEEWVDNHGSSIGRKRDLWRSLSRADKEKIHGMKDLWDPVKRAQLCASCHIGDVSQRKVVTHEMYAAGHPPLPGFEVAIFSDEMPRHWQYLREKLKDAKNEEERQLFTTYYHTPKFERTQLLLVGAAVSLRQSMGVLQAQAEEADPAKGPAARAIDLAQFDCYACHHDLKISSWRRELGYAGRPGRPQARPWPMALIEAGIFYAGGNVASLTEEFQAQRSRLSKAFDEQPFGDARLIAATARDLHTFAGQLAQQLEAVNYQDNAKLLQLLKHLCQEASTKPVDYDSARQLTWAFRIILDDTDPKPANHLEIRVQLDELGRMLRDRLPSGQDKKLVKELPQVLQVINAYDLRDFRKSMRELGRLLDQSPGP
jgi:hypothetical protein